MVVDDDPSSDRAILRARLTGDDPELTVEEISKIRQFLETCPDENWIKVCCIATVIRIIFFEYASVIYRIVLILFWKMHCRGNYLMQYSSSVNKDQ